MWVITHFANLLLFYFLPRKALYTKWTSTNIIKFHPEISMYTSGSLKCSLRLGKISAKVQWLPRSESNQKTCSWTQMVSGSPDMSELSLQVIKIITEKQGKLISFSSKHTSLKAMLNLRRDCTGQMFLFSANCKRNTWVKPCCAVPFQKMGHLLQIPRDCY